MAKLVKYNGPNGVLIVDGKELIAGGDAVEMGNARAEYLQKEGHDVTVTDAPEKEQAPPAKEGK